MREEMRDWQPEVGDFVQPDGWGQGEMLRESDGFKDSSFPGCQFRLPANVLQIEVAVNVRVTSRKVRVRWGSWGWVRVEVEFVGDGEPSTFSRGWMRKNRR